MSWPGALVEALGAEAVQRHEPTLVDGVEVGVTLRPRDAAGLALALGSLGRLSLAALVRGGGSQLGLGNPPRRADVLLSTEQLRGVDELDAGEGVCHARAGTPLAELARAVRAEGWELPLDPPARAATLGGTLATAAVGPRCLGFGRPRDLVLGMEVALASGERTRCGGRVVKNVTGYDLAKLYTGSFGTLGVIEGAWLRLRPLPERTWTGQAELADLETACARAIAAARRPTARAAAVASGDGGGFRLVVELAGDAPSVERDAAELGWDAATADALDEIRAQQARVPGSEGLRFRLSLRPSRLAAALRRLGAAGAECLAYPEPGLVWAGFPLDGTDARSAADAAWAQVAAAARESGGSFRLEAAPVWAKQGRDVFGEPSPGEPLARALKERFDPGRVLNPGRFAGHL